MNKFKNKYGPWAVVTGATSGIGREMATQLASMGLNIIAVARSTDRLEFLREDLKTNYGIKVETISEDLSLPESSQSIFKKTSHLDVGLLIANAGTENSGSFIENNFRDESKLLALNIVSPMQLTHLFGKKFAEKGSGGIILISSLFGYQGVPLVANYSATKAYILTLGEALNVEFKPLGVDVTVLSPGLTKTPMSENMTIDFRKVPITSHSPAKVAKIGLGALGRKATVVPGLINKIYAWENRFIPRSWPVKLFGFLLKRASYQKVANRERVVL